MLTTTVQKGTTVLPAATLTVGHHDDHRTTYTGIRYGLDRQGVRIATPDGAEHRHDDVLTIQVTTPTTEESR